MRRHYYVGTDLQEISRVERELEDAGMSVHQIHVLSDDDAAVERAHLNEVEAVLRKDVVHGTERGAVLGVIGAAVVLLLFWVSGLTETYTWIPAIFLAVVVLGFCTWEGGLIGIQAPHTDFARFHDTLASGGHVLLVDIEPGQEALLQRVVAGHPALQAAGEGSPTPGWVIGARRKWSRFLELAP